MKIFNKDSGWDSKVNFVDSNNVVLGFDIAQCCCEEADWFIADSPTHKILDRKETIDGTPEEMVGWNFDPNYFQKVNYVPSSGKPHEYNVLEEGSMVIFRIVKGDGEKFIHLYNCHNGYYSHGFNLNVEGRTIHDGDI
jgi:hypothetical protein